jgi:hypothetical protein
MKRKALGWALLIGLGGLLLAGGMLPAATPVAAPTATPTATVAGTPIPELILTLTYNRLDKPQVSSPPTQADKGAVYYWLVCIPCHGDKGQGLTEEWREVFGPEEKNCWQAECHGKRHPDDGFELPRTAPPVLGAVALGRFNNAAELHHVISTSMPWYRPSYMNSEESWQVTAFLLRQHGVLPPQVTLTEANAPVFRLRAPAPQVAEERPITLATIGLLALAVAGIIWHYRKPAA